MRIAFYIVGVWLAFVLSIAACSGAFALPLGDTGPSGPPGVEGEDTWQDRPCKYADSIWSQYEDDMMLAYGGDSEQMFFVLRDWTGVVFNPNADGLYCSEARLNEEDTMILLHYTQYSMERACPE